MACLCKGQTGDTTALGNSTISASASTCSTCLMTPSLVVRNINVGVLASWGSLYRQRPLYNCSPPLVGFFWHMYCPSSEWDSRGGNELSSSSVQHKCDRPSACRILLIESIWRVELVCMRIEKRVNKARSIAGNPDCKKGLFWYLRSFMYGSNRANSIMQQ